MREFVEVGGLMAYGVDIADVERRVAGMIGQVLGGAKPSDIPFYRQTKYDLMLNQKTATSLGLEFPPALSRPGRAFTIAFALAHLPAMRQ